MTFYGRIRTIDRILIRPKRFGSDRIRNTACTPNYSSWTKLTPPPFISPVFVRPLAALKNLFFKVFNTAQVFSYLDQRELCGPSAVSSRFPIQYISVVDPNTLNPDPGLCYHIIKKKKKIILESNNFLNKKYLYNQKNFLVSWFSIWWIYVVNLATFVLNLRICGYGSVLGIRIHKAPEYGSGSTTLQYICIYCIYVLQS